MTAGFQVWDSDGSLQIDVATRMFRGISLLSIGTGPGSATVSTGGGTLLAYVKGIPNTSLPERTISISGNTVSWSSGRGN